MTDYKPLSGTAARKELNNLGYDIKASDGAIEAVLGMIVTLAKRVKELESQKP